VFVVPGKVSSGGSSETSSNPAGGNGDKKKSDSNEPRPFQKAPVPDHFFGKLCRLPAGAAILRECGFVTPLLRRITSAINAEPRGKDLTKVKAALWSIGHIASSEPGLELLDLSAFAAIVELANASAVLTLRGTAVFVLGLLGETQQGEEWLLQLGWGVRCNRGCVFFVLS
jgi:hypothetical protein